MGGSNLLQAFPNYLICMHFIRISTVPTKRSPHSALPTKLVPHSALPTRHAPHTDQHTNVPHIQPCPPSSVVDCRQKWNICFSRDVWSLIVCFSSRNTPTPMTCSCVERRSSQGPNESTTQTCWLRGPLLTALVCGCMCSCWHDS